MEKSFLTEVSVRTRPRQGDPINKETKLGMKYVLTNILYLAILLTSVSLVAEDGRNVLLIGADDLRMNIGAYGDKTAVTPNIDALAKEGVMFTRAYVQFASCNASRASMLTGMRPDSIKVWRLNSHFRESAPDVVTLPQHFKNNGYHTESIGKVYHNYANIRDATSWSVPARLDQEDHFTDYALATSIEEGATTGIAAESAEYDGDRYVDDRITTSAIDTLERLRGEIKPFFLAVGFMKPHSPYNAPRKYWDLYNREDMQALGSEAKPEDAPDQNWFQFKEIRNLTDLPDKGPFSDETAKRLRHGYYAATSYMDDNVGRIVKALKDNGLYENTIIVFWSDHGYHLGENGHWTKATTRELDTRSPLIFRIPGQSAFTTDAITEYIDIYPTLSELAGLSAPVGLDGKSFVNVLVDPTHRTKFVAYSQTARPWPGNKPITHMGYTVRTAEYRYTRWIKVKDGRMVAEELYHTETDPLERQNLIETAEHPVLAEMRELLELRGDPINPMRRVQSSAAG